MKPEVSIIVPVYNVEKYITKCIDSIKCQTLLNIEIILVDDGSTDLSGAICDKYAESDSRIKVIHKINEGVSVARNTGLSVALGEYIGFVDSDDFIDKKMFEMLLSSIKSYSADISICNIGYINNEELIKHENENYNPVNISKEEVLKKVFDVTGFVTVCCVNKLYKKESIVGISFPTGKRIAEDLQFLYSSLVKANNIVYVPFTGYYYVLARNGAITNSTFGVHEYDRYQIINKIVEDACINYPGIIKSVYGFKIGNGTLSIANAMLRSQNYDCDFLVRLQRETRKDYIKIMTSSLTIKKKIQAFIFMINFKLYKKMYESLKGRRS